MEQQLVGLIHQVLLLGLGIQAFDRGVRELRDVADVLRFVEVLVDEALLHFFEGLVFLQPGQHVRLGLLEQRFAALNFFEVLDLLHI